MLTETSGKTYASHGVTDEVIAKVQQDDTHDIRQGRTILHTHMGGDRDTTGNQRDIMKRFRSVAFRGVVIGMTSFMPSPVHAQGARPAASAPYAQPPLDGLSLGMAYNRMMGTTPDFRPAAERSGAYRNATTFDRPAVLTREISRLEGAFHTFDLDRTYAMRIDVNVLQYDPQRGGFPLDFGPASQIQMNDPASFHSYALAFRNADDADVVAVGDATAARNLAQANRLDTQGTIAGRATLQMVFRLADAPPTLNNAPDTVRADILAARLLNGDGSVLHDFGSLASQGAATARAADGTPAVPVLKVADVQGFRIGMPMAEAEALGSRGWTTKLGPEGLATVLFFNGMKPATATWARCGGMEYGSPDPMALYAGVAATPQFTDCVGVRLDGNASPGSSHTVVAMASRQLLGSTSPATVLASLRGKFGSPTYVRNQGNNLVWLGRDPAHLDAPPVQVTADVRENPEAGVHGTVLTVTVEPYRDPHPKPVPQAASVAAKL